MLKQHEVKEKIEFREFQRKKMNLDLMADINQDQKKGLNLIQASNP